MQVMNIPAAAMMKFMGRPILAKSENLYPPGTYTIIWVGEPIGVAKLELTATIKAMRKVIGLEPVNVAALMAMG